MRNKTSVFVRSCIVVFVIYISLSTVWNSLSGTSLWTPFEMFVAAILTVLFYGGIAWLVTNVGMGLLFGRTTEYQRYRQRGDDPLYFGVRDSSEPYGD